MTIAELVKQLREYHVAAMAEGFTSTEAMDLAKAYQQTRLTNDLLERLQSNGDKPWERK